MACPSITGLNSPMVLFSPDVKEEEESSYFFTFSYLLSHPSILQSHVFTESEKVKVRTPLLHILVSSLSLGSGHRVMADI